VSVSAASDAPSSPGPRVLGDHRRSSVFAQQFVQFISQNKQLGALRSPRAMQTFILIVIPPTVLLVLVVARSEAEDISNLSNFSSDYTPKQWIVLASIVLPCLSFANYTLAMIFANKNNHQACHQSLVVAQLQSTAIFIWLGVATLQNNSEACPQELRLRGPCVANTRDLPVGLVSLVLAVWNSLTIIAQTHLIAFDRNITSSEHDYWRALPLTGLFTSSSLSMGIYFGVCLLVRTHVDVTGSLSPSLPLSLLYPSIHPFIPLSRSLSTSRARSLSLTT